MYVDEPPKDGNIPDFNISKIDICPFRAYQRSFRLFQSDFSKDIYQRSRLLCFTQNDHTGHAGFKICPFLKWAHHIKGQCVQSWKGCPLADRLNESLGFKSVHSFRICHSRKEVVWIRFSQRLSYMKTHFYGRTVTNRSRNHAQSKEKQAIPWSTRIKSVPLQIELWGEVNRRISVHLHFH